MKKIEEMGERRNNSQTKCNPGERGWNFAASQENWP